MNTKFNHNQSFNYMLTCIISKTCLKQICISNQSAVCSMTSVRLQDGEPLVCSVMSFPCIMLYSVIVCKMVDFVRGRQQFI